MDMGVMGAGAICHDALGALVIIKMRFFELIEEEVAQHRLGAHPLRLSVTVEDPAEGETCKASREQGLMRCETHLRYPIKPFKIRYKSGKTETYGANYPSINRLMFAVENLLHDFMPLRSEIDAK